MAKFQGTLKKNPLEGGFWELHADDGEHYQLEGADPAALKEGARVTVEGTIDEEAFGIGMTGPTIEVKKITSP